MSSAPLVPEFDTRLVEASVLYAIRGHADEREFHAERDCVYSIEESAPREAGFETVHARWFARLALDRPFCQALAEQPAVAAACARWLVATSLGRRDEAADLLVGAGVAPTLLVRVAGETVADPGRLWPLLRRELLHVADMLDPAFGYEGALPADVAGGVRERAVRASYRILWDVYVDGRLVRLGALPPTVRDECLREFTRAFPRLGTAVTATFERLFAGRGLTHGWLLALASGGPP